MQRESQRFAAVFCSAVRCKLEEAHKGLCELEKLRRTRPVYSVFVADIPEQIEQVNETIRILDLLSDVAGDCARFLDCYSEQPGLPSASDLDRVAEEAEIAAETRGGLCEVVMVPRLGLLCGHRLPCPLHSHVEKS